MFLSVRPWQIEGVIFCNIYLTAETRLNTEVTGFVKENTCCTQWRAVQRQQSWGNSQASAAAWLLHSTLREAGDMSCEWIECEPSSHSSGNIIPSLAGLCLFCPAMLLKWIFLLSPPVHKLQAKSSLGPQSCAVFMQTIPERKQTALVFHANDQMTWSHMR